MAEYYVSAMVAYAISVEADSPEEAAEYFECECPYDIDGDICVTDKETDETYEL